MVSGKLEKDCPKYFFWEKGLSEEDYVIATYYLESKVDLKSAAGGIGREQTAINWKFVGDKEYEYAKDYAARVMEIKNLGTTTVKKLDSFALKTTVYGYQPKEETFNKGIVKIAYPQRNFNTSFVNMLNVMAGESHRLGYLNAIKLLDVQFNDDFVRAYNGPKFGVGAIRKLLEVKDRPIFCRATRPPVGLKIKDIARMARECLLGGFDIFKDDELTNDTERAPFKDRVRELVQVIDKVETETGEKKLYFANVIDDNEHMNELIDVAKENGADGIIFAPIMSGCSLMKTVSEQRDMPILAHNSYIDVETRHPEFGIAYPLWLKFQRMCGGDLIMAPAKFGTAFMGEKESKEVVDTCLGEFHGFKKSIPIMAGGRHSYELPSYLKIVGSPDFMLIVAAALDDHPQGLTAGARSFRQAWEAIEKNISIEEYSKTHEELKNDISNKG